MTDQIYQPPPSPARTAAPFKLEVRSVTVCFRSGGGSVVALEDLDLQVRDGEFVSIVGPSGSGKSTLLNVIAGLLPPESGEVLIDGQVKHGIVRSIGYMSSRDSLLPWRTVEGNVKLGLEIAGVDSHTRSEIAGAMLNAVGLAPYHDYYPSQLSSGMRQRVAIARTFSAAPEILLMDEPFGALDAQTRLQVQELFIKQWSEGKRTAIFVTHDVSEALMLSDRVVIVSSRPARIIDQMEISYPRPRDLREVRRAPDFADRFERILELLHNDPQ